MFELMKGNFRAACDDDWRDKADYYGGPQRMKRRGPLLDYVKFHFGFGECQSVGSTLPKTGH